MLFNHCKHQRWRIWWRENWLLLCVFDQTGALMPSPSSFQCRSFICDTTTGPQALGSAQGEHFPAYISIPWGIQPQGWCPSQPRGTRCHSYPTMSSDRPRCHSVSQGLPSKAWKFTLCFCNTSHPWVSLCSAGKPVESRNLVGIHGRCAAGREVQGTSEGDTRGTAGGFLPQDGAQCRLQSISRKLQNTQSIWISLHCQLCLQADKLQSDWEKKNRVGEGLDHVWKSTIPKRVMGGEKRQLL